MTMKPIIPDDIQERAQAIVKSMAGTDFTESEQHAVGMMIAFAMSTERYRCVDIIEQFDPEQAARLWRNDQ